MRESFQMPAEPRLMVKIPAGASTSRRTPAPRLSCAAVAARGDAETREAIEQAHVELHGNVVVESRTAAPVSQPAGDPCRDPLPDRTSARLHTASGDIQARGTLGETKTARLGRRRGRSRRRAPGCALGQRGCRGGVRGRRRVDPHGVGRCRHPPFRRGREGRAPRGMSTSATPAGARSGSSRRRVMSASPSGPGAASRSTFARSAARQARHPAGRLRREDADAPLVEIQVNGVSGDVRIERATSEVGALESQCKVKEPAGISTYPRRRRPRRLLAQLDH